MPDDGRSNDLRQRDGSQELTMSYAKPLPVVDADTKPFWDGCRQGKLLLQRCAQCGRVRFPPTHFCPKCNSPAVETIESKGRGRVFSWIVVRHPVPRDIYAAEVPYVVALITLDEGVRIPSNIVGIAPEKVTADMPVRVTFREVTPEITLPVFEPVSGPQ
jgi:uncharacterized protein